MSLRAVIPALGGKSFRFTRSTASTYTNGRLVAGASSEFSAVCSIQPMSGRERLTFPESERTRDMRVLYTRAILKAREPGHEPDRVTIGSESFEVVRSETWEAFGESHSRAYIAKVSSP